MPNAKETLRLNVDRPEASSSSRTKQPSSSRDRLPSHHPSTTKDGSKVSSSSMNKAHPPSFLPPSCPPPAYQTHAPSQWMSSQYHHSNDERAKQSSHRSFHREHASHASSAHHHSSHANQKRYPQSIPAKSHHAPSVVQPSLKQPSHAATAKQQSYAGASQSHNSSHHNASHHHASQHNTSNQHSSMRKTPLLSAPPREPSVHHSSMRKPPIPELIYKPSRPPATTAPPIAKSIFTTKEDLHMASRQTQIESMRDEEREKQEEWAQSLIRRAGVCPEGYTWTRMAGGYQCNGFGHGMTDELLAEGKGGIFALRTKDWNNKQGPYYPSSDGSGKYYAVVKSENHGSTRF